MWRQGRRAAAAVLVAAVLLISCSGDDSDDDSEALRIEVVSSQPQYVTGGNALVAVTGGDDVDLEDLEVLSGGEDVSEAFAADPDRSGRVVGLIEGLPEGEIVLEASAGGASVELTVTNHPTTGPLFAGEPVPLMVCTTEDLGLEPSTPEEGCYAPTEETWAYVDTRGEVHDLDDPSDVPDDVQLLDLDEREVPFVIRAETGVLNRSVYQIRTLADEGAWNRRLAYRFGGGCGATFSQGNIAPYLPWLDVLERGYATATATFNTYGVLCNDALSAETMSMVKEHFIVTYGEPVHTIGDGGSGGAIQQLLLAQNHPGLLDGIAPSFPFPDSLSILGGVVDCRLLNTYYGSGPGSELTEEQRLAVNGHATLDACGTWDAGFVDGIVPTTGCAEGVEDVYDPEDNPDGIRCTFFQTNVALTGQDPETGFARPAYDNEGVQYGLQALNEGIITPEQFLDLNEQVGGFDIDGQPQGARSAVAEDQVAGAYESGRITGPWGGLPDTPIVLLDIYTDLTGDFHDRVRSFAFLDRMAGGDGDDSGKWPATVSLWSAGDTDLDMIAGVTGDLGDIAAAATFALDEWLTAAEDHQVTEGGSWQAALAEAKPQAAQSRCMVAGSDPMVGPDANGDPACSDALPVHGEPRMAAGAPRSGLILKCQRVPVDEAVSSGMYDVDLDEDLLARLVAIFPDGVCDYSRPGIGQGEPATTWPSF